MHIITDERCTGYFSRGHPERPARVAKTAERLRQQTELELDWSGPDTVAEAALLRAHEAALIEQVKAAAQDFDGDTPAHPNIFEHAMRSVGGAVKAMGLARRGQAALSLLRPPGHHATPTRAMGFCYLNAVAIASLQALADGVKRVAVYDLDVHHGNGTEDIFLNKPNVAFYSIHQFPCYPGTGAKHRGDNVFNYPVAPRTPREDYRRVLERALSDLKDFNPELVGVSAGFDAYARDPLAQETLEAEDFHWMGKALRDLKVPVFSVLEGGYSSDLPELILAFLNGISGKGLQASIP